MDPLSRIISISIKVEIVLRCGGLSYPLSIGGDLKNLAAKDSKKKAESSNRRHVKNLEFGAHEYCHYDVHVRVMGWFQNNCSTQLITSLLLILNTQSCRTESLPSVEKKNINHTVVFFQNIEYYCE